MQVNLLQNKKTLFLIILCVLALGLIRGFESRLFYDPFLAYFRNDYLTLPWPEFEKVPFVGSLTFRYVLNSFFSLLVLQLLFKDSKLTKFSLWLYIILFVVLLGLLLSILYFGSEKQNFIFFYVRRFLMQPLFVLLFIPAFYFQKLQKH